MAIISFIDPMMAPYLSTFLFIFAVVFGLLSYAKVGDFGKRINAIIALAFALFSIFYPPLVLGLQQWLPVAVVLLIILFFILFVKKMFASEKSGDTFPMAIALATLLIVFAVLGDRILGYLPAGFDLDTMSWIVGIIIVILFFWTVYNYKGGSGGGQTK
jgi:hypothetical protein